MAQNAIGNSANILLQGGQMYQQANNKIFDAISQAAAAYEAAQRQKEANLAAERQKQMEIEAQQAKQAQADARDPSVILAKANQFGVQSLTPQERAYFDASQALAANKMTLDAAGRPVQTTTPINLDALGQSPAAGMMFPQAKAEALPAQTSAVGEYFLTPPRTDGKTGTSEQFARDMGKPLPSPMGRKDEKVLAAPFAVDPSIDSSPVSEINKVKGNIDVIKDQAIKRMDEQRGENKARFNDQKSFKTLMDDVLNVTKKASAASKMVSGLNTGPMAGEGGKGLLGSGFITGGRDLAETLTTIQSDAALGALADMKANSANGASGLGATSDAELNLIKSKKQSLAQDQSPEQLKQNLAEYQQQRLNMVRNVAEAFKERYGEYPKGYDPKKFAPATSTNAPKMGEVVDGWKFLGGDPSDQTRWRKVK